MARQKIKGISISSANAAGNANATSGYVLKADGSGGAAWSADSVVAGISSSADATAITIDSNENVMIGTTTASGLLNVDGNLHYGGQLRVNDASHDGSASAPHLCVGYDNDTGFFRPSANTIGITTAGTEKMRLASDGDFFLNTTSAMDNCFASFQDGNNGEAMFGISAKDDSNVGIRFGVGTTRKWVNYRDTSDNLIWYSNANSAERLRINSDGKVGIGTSSPATILHAKASGDAELRLEAGTNSDARVRFGDATDNDLGYIGFNRNSGYMNFSISNTQGEHMRINSNGTLMVGTTTNATYVHKAHFSGNANIDGIVRIEDVDTTVALSNTVLGLAFAGDNDATNGYFVYMTDGNGAIGSIQAASGTSVSYSTTSDERLKKNIVDASSQLNTIKNIKVREFDWKRNDYHELGVIAQEIQSLVPNAITGGGDDETKHPFGVDYGKIVPYLIKAVQEQQTIIDDLKSRIETLESK
jgi:hypothetical protein